MRVSHRSPILALAEHAARVSHYVMATGTGKTYTAFQIIWRLWKAGVKKRIRFLADRNILVDQTKTNDFKPFGQAMTKILTARSISHSKYTFRSIRKTLDGDGFSTTFRMPSHLGLTATP